MPANCCFVTKLSIFTRVCWATVASDSSNPLQARCSRSMPYNQSVPLPRCCSELRTLESLLFHRFIVLPGFSFSAPEVSELLFFHPPKYDADGVLIDPGTYRMGGWHHPSSAHYFVWMSECDTIDPVAIRIVSWFGAGHLAR